MNDRPGRRDKTKDARGLYNATWYWGHGSRSGSSGASAGAGETAAKLPGMGVSDGVTAELQVLRAMEAQAAGEACAVVAVRKGTREVHAMGFRGRIGGDTAEGAACEGDVYAAPECGAAAAAVREYLNRHR